MCPDLEMLSVYTDGELPSPWKEKMEGHLARCPQCREKLESYRLVSVSAAVDTALVDAAKERVWRNLEARKRAGDRSGVFTRRVSVWRRSISIPFPAVVAAAAVLVVAMGGLWIRRPVEQQQPAVIPQMAVVPEEAFGPPEVVPTATNMNDVLRYLGSTDNGDILILRLPESRNFKSSGEPAIVKAVDYSRGQP